VFLAQLKVSPVTSWLLWATSGLSAVTLPSSVIQAREGWELLLRRRWRRAGQPPSRRFRGYPPRVSVHVPCHAEPPHIVIDTLNRLARLDYPDFEVLVIDNNTTDPQLWRPVAAHCARLGPRFRFFHVEGITGAKAGALNWVLPRTCPRAELIAVVDADYQVRPDWLRATVGYFADPGIGFVQCPHAYRDYGASVLGRWANWEYRVFFATSMVSLDEHRAGITVGTMSLIRRAALLRAGGWAEWCLTEDSELAIRIHAVGYQSVYLTRPYGWGLIPETFDGYRKQRFRWTYGPVQEFRRHWRLFLPRPLAAPSALTPAQKLHHANHGLDVMCIGLRALCLPLGAAAAASMAIHHERVMMPVQLWAAATCVLAASLLMRWLVYMHVVRATPRQALGGILAFAALTHVITMASLRALAGRPARWQRTSKFRQRSSGVRALAGARSETVIGIAGPSPPPGSATSPEAASARRLLSAWPCRPSPTWPPRWSPSPPTAASRRTPTPSSTPAARPCTPRCIQGMVKPATHQVPGSDPGTRALTATGHPAPIPRDNGRPGTPATARSARQPGTKTQITIRDRGAESNHRPDDRSQSRRRLGS